MKTKQANATQKKEIKKTGGGEQPKDMSEIQKAVLNVVGCSKSFQGEKDYFETSIGSSRCDEMEEEHYDVENEAPSAKPPKIRRVENDIAEIRC